MSFTGTAMVELSYEQVVEAVKQLSPEQLDSLMVELKAKKAKVEKAKKKLTKKQAARKAHILKSIEEGVADVNAHLRGEPSGVRPAKEFLNELRSQL